MDIAIVGGGFVGVTTAIVLAEKGHSVRIIERDASRREALAAENVPFFEPGVQESLTKLRLPVLPDLSDAVAGSLVFLCVGTPSRDDGSCDTSYIEAAAGDIASAMKGKKPIVVTKSTVPPGTNRNVLLPALAPLGELGADFGLASNPEFLREGAALVDARAPDRTVIGPFDDLSKSALSKLYTDEPLQVTTPEAAEMCKYASNAMLAARISFANEVSRICEQVGVNVDEVMRLVGMDKRIGPHFLSAGPGFGGSCFPKDVAALRAVAATLGVESALLDATLRVNDTQPEHVVARLEHLCGGLSGKTVALLGVAFKPDTSDVRETRALPIYLGLRKAGADVVCYDPMAESEFKRVAGEARFAPSVQEAVGRADATILHTDWADVKAGVLGVEAPGMNHILLDCRRCLSPEEVTNLGYSYHQIGVGP